MVVDFCFPFCPCSRDIVPAIRKTQHVKDVVSTAASESVQFAIWLLFFFWHAKLLKSYIRPSLLW